MEKEKSNNQNKISNQGYVIVPNYFLRGWVSKLGIGPALLYLQLLTYCHKEKDIAWPSLTTLSNKLAISKNSLLKYRKILLKYGLIKKIVKRRNIRGNYQPNFYKVIPIESAKNELHQVHNLGGGSAKIAPGVVQNLHPNNNNINNTNITTTNREKGAVAVVVDFKKLEKAPPAKAGEKGEERMIRERMLELDFKESFIEKILKVYSIKKIEEKLDLLMEGKNIQNPASWLRAALKYDYQNPEPEEREEEEEREKVDYKKVNQKKEASSREVALEMIRNTREMLANLKKKEEMCNGTKRINCQS